MYDTLSRPLDVSKVFFAARSILNRMHAKTRRPWTCTPPLLARYAALERGALRRDTPHERRHGNLPADVGSCTAG